MVLYIYGTMVLVLIGMVDGREKREERRKTSM